MNAGFICLPILLAAAQTAAQAGPQDKPAAPVVPAVPGVVIDHSPASSRSYIGSPGIAILGAGRYAASHDFFGPGTTNDRTAVFTSEDRGATWKKIADLEGQWWSSLFSFRGALYLLGTSRQDGFAVIRRSTDGGRTWTSPRDRSSGLLLADGKYHCAPVPVIEHEGRLWRAMEDAGGPGGWGKRFSSFLMSAPADADLLEASSWTFSNRLGYDAAWLDGKFGGWLEGNAVVTPDRKVAIILRVDFRDGNEKAAIIRASEDGKKLSFDPAADFIPFPGGCKKFTIRRDPRDGVYWSLTNVVPESLRGGNPERTRNTAALIRSADLRTWEVRRIILQHPDPLHHAFQYLDWQFEGEDIIAVSRTAFDDGLGGAHNQHDANYMTFHRIAGFRKPAP